MENRLLAPDLYAYLTSLSALLGVAGETDAANQVLHVSKFASGSTSELYGEAASLLPRILREFGGKLSGLERTRLHDVIAGIEGEFRKIGGG